MVTRLGRTAVVFGALADATRLGVLQRLAQGPATAGQLAQLFATSRPAVSRHVRVLREAGLVSATPNGRNVWYEAEGEPLHEAERWLSETAKRIGDAPALMEERR
jgi:DNA-binding transcriptional ArsR family regulator